MNHELDEMIKAAEQNGVRFEGVQEGAREPLGLFTDPRHQSTFAVPIRAGVDGLAHRANVVAIEHGFQPIFNTNPKESKTPCNRL